MRATTLALLLLLSACASDSKPAATTAPTTTTVATVAFVATDCPVGDETFCATAAQAANALGARDADALLALSRADRIVCAEMAPGAIAGCESNDVLEGHGVSGPDLVTTLVSEDEYLVRLQGLTTEIVPGSMQLFGVGTCGPNQPDRRTYHLSWTADVNDADGTVIPIVGSFEFNFVDEWRIVLFYVGTLEDWQAAPNDPFTESFCEAGRTPWRN